MLVEKKLNFNIMLILVKEKSCILQSVKTILEII